MHRTWLGEVAVALAMVVTMAALSASVRSLQDGGPAVRHDNNLQESSSEASDSTR